MIMMNRKEEYKYIWKVIQDIRNNSQKIENIKFLIPKEKISSYMELNDGKLNAIEIDKNEIEVNPYVRFNSIFNSLNDYLIEEEEILEKAINNIMFHLLAEVDLQEGINYKYIILKKYIELMENGYFGEFVKNNIKYFSKTEKMKIARYLKSSVENLTQEVFIVLDINTKGKIIQQREVFKGSLSTSIVHSREVFKMAIKNSAASIVCIHNHPSGDATPSVEDIRTTINLMEVGDIIGIEMLDHLIIAKEGYVSIRRFLNYLASENIDYRNEEITSEQLRYILKKYKVKNSF